MSKKKQISGTSTLSTSKTSTKISVEQYINYIIAFVALIPLFNMFQTVNNYTLNLPFMDDWDAILGFLTKWNNTESFYQRIVLLFSQHNEHRILSSRLIYVLYHSVFGEINFTNLIYIVNFQLIVISLLIIYFSKKYLPQFWGFVAIILSMCIFDLSSYENSDFAMAGMQNYGVIMLFLLSLFFYSLQSEKWYFLALAVFFQFLCHFSSGNGMLAGLSLLLYTIFNKQKIKIIISAASFILFSSFYFFHLNKTGNNFTGDNLSDIVFFFLNLSGGHFGYENRILAALVLYIAIGIIFLFKRKTNSIFYTKEMLPFVSILLFILMSMGITSIFRSGGNIDINQVSYSSRYLIYPHILSAIVFVLVLKRTMNKILKWGLIFALGLIFLNTYKQNSDYGTKGFERTNYRLHTQKYMYPDTSAAHNISTEACNKKIYCIENNRFE